MGQAVVGNGPQCTEGLQPRLQPSLQDPPLAATADTTPAHPPVHRSGRLYLKQAPADFTKGCLTMAWAGWEAGTCPTWDEGRALWAELVADG